MPDTQIEVWVGLERVVIVGSPCIYAALQWVYLGITCSVGCCTELYLGHDKIVSGQHLARFHRRIER